MWCLFASVGMRAGDANAMLYFWAPAAHLAAPCLAVVFVFRCVCVRRAVRTLALSLLALRGCPCTIVHMAASNVFK